MDDTAAVQGRSAGARTECLTIFWTALRVARWRSTASRPRRSRLPRCFRPVTCDGGRAQEQHDRRGGALLHSARQHRQRWVVLEDTQAHQPADNIAPIVRNDFLAKLSDRAAFETTLNEISAKIDTPTLADLYKQVTVDRKDPKQVATDWLRAHAFIQ